MSEPVLLDGDLGARCAICGKNDWYQCRQHFVEEARQLREALRRLHDAGDALFLSAHLDMSRHLPLGVALHDALTESGKVLTKYEDVRVRTSPSMPEASDYARTSDENKGDPR